MPSKKLKIYSNQEFKEADTIDRIYMWMIEPERFDLLLTDEEEKYFYAMHRAYGGCYKELRRSAAIRYIQQNVTYYESAAKASRLLDDMQKLFGKFLDKNLALKQSILVEKMYEDAERLIKLSKEFEGEKDFDGAVNCIEKANNIRDKAAKLEGLDKVQKNMLPEDIALPQVIITSDVKVLKEAEMAD